MLALGAGVFPGYDDNGVAIVVAALLAGGQARGEEGVEAVLRERRWGAQAGRVAERIDRVRLRQRTSPATHEDDLLHDADADCRVALCGKDEQGEELDGGDGDEAGEREVDEEPDERRRRDHGRGKVLHPRGVHDGPLAGEAVEEGEGEQAGEDEHADRRGGGWRAEEREGGFAG